MPDNRIFYAIQLLLLLCLASCAGEQKPNIILIYTDDLGYGDLSSYGGDIPTPNIDRIGTEGIRFTEFYVAAPACTPSRYSLLTGCYPQRSRHGLDQVIMPGDDYHFDDAEVLLPEMLKTQGYITGIVGKWHLGDLHPSYWPTRHGFDVFSGHKGGAVDYFHHEYGPLYDDWFVNGAPSEEEGYTTELITRHGIDFIDQAREKSNPFFLFLSYNAPHYAKTDPTNTCGVTEVLDERIQDSLKVWNTLQAPAEYVKQFSHIKDVYRRVYAAMVANLDDNIGKVLDKLEEDDLIENTMIWFISDNGGYSIEMCRHASNGSLKGEKATLQEGGIRVPAMVRWKGKIQPGQISHQFICNVDIVPTLGAVTGYADTLSNYPIDGIDISKVLFQQDTIANERDFYWCYSNQTAFRRGDWKLYNYDELYNLKTDISEENNLAAAHPEKLQELIQAFEQVDNTLEVYKKY